MTSTLYLNVSIYPLAYGAAAVTLYADIWLASAFLTPPSGPTPAEATAPAGTTTVAVVMGGTACDITGLDNTKSYWLRVFNPQGYSHWFPVGWSSGASALHPQVVSVPAIEGPIVAPPPVSGSPASLSGAGLTTSPGKLVQTGPLTVDDASTTGVILESAGQMALSGGVAGVYLSSSGPLYLVNYSADDTWINAYGGGRILLTGPTFLFQGGAGSFSADCAKVGFYGVTPVAQAGVPVTLADVITLLTNLGLCAP